MCIYQMYCTNLNYKPLSKSELSELKLEDELINSKWGLYENKIELVFYLVFKGFQLVILILF